MPGLVDFDCEGTLTIGSVLMNRAAWMIAGDEEGSNGLVQLWVTAEQRGEDRILPSATGVIPYRRRLTATRHDLRLVVTGDVTDAGVATSNSKTGLMTNLNYIYTNVVAPTGATDGTRAATLTFTGITSRTANIHVLGLQVTRFNLATDSAVFEGVLQISIPAGRFA